MEKSQYIKIGNAGELKEPNDRRLYRFFEILPGALAWATLLGVVFLSWLAPIGIAFFIIAFDIYWFLKTLFLSLHLRASFSRMRRVAKVDWTRELKKNSGRFDLPWEDIYHLVIFPMHKESYQVVAETFGSLLGADYPLDKIIVVLSVEERAGGAAQETARKIARDYGAKLKYFLLTTHPADIAGELAGKGSNETWAAREVKEKIIDAAGISYENVLVSVFDVDTVFGRQYFSRLAYVFLETPDRLHTSFQPIPVFNNNIWDAPSFSRVAAQSGTFWHMMQQERPERLATFSSHAMNFKALYEMDFWSTKNVSEDSRIFWQALLFYDGAYKVAPLYYPVSMDANLAATFWQTAINVYKQQRRWGWGAENIPYLLFGFWQNKKISPRVKLIWAFNHLEGFWSWATNALLIFMLGWLPLFLGGQQFNVTLLSYNLPQITRVIMTLAMIGMVSSAVYGVILLPSRSARHGRWRYSLMILQWLMLPFSIIFFGSMPGLEAQTRLMLGRYMGFWVTPKERR